MAVAPHFTQVLVAERTARQAAHLAGSFVRVAFFANGSIHTGQHFGDRRSFDSDEVRF
jgi:hypothetical protein